MKVRNDGRENGRTQKRNHIVRAVKIFGVLFCTVVGGYGVLRAPESDQEKLERELRQKEAQIEQELEQEPVQESGQRECTAGRTGASGEKTGGDRSETAPAPEKITVIGDSVFLGAAPSFRRLEKNTVIDAKISRQVYQALDVAKKLKKKNKLANTVILSLGINGRFHPDTGQALIDYLGKDRTVYWINAFGKEKNIQRDVNETIRKLSQKNGNLKVISWDDEAKKHPDWFYQDGTHLNEKGQEGFARFVEEQLAAGRSGQSLNT